MPGHAPNRHLVLVFAISLGISLGWGSALSAATFDIKPDQTMIGELRYIEARGDETLLEVAYEFDFGYEELVAANPDIDVWDLKRGARIVLPSRFILPEGPRTGVYINTASYRMYYYPEEFKGAKVITYPISVGRGEWPTPEKEALIIDKLVSPAWYPPKTVREEHKEEWGEELELVVPPGPDNPLGEYALQLNLPGYLIHGTNKPYGIGMNVTHGCIRLRPDDINSFFQLVPRGTSVRIVNEPYAVAVEDGVVYLEAHTGEADEDELAVKLTNTIKRSLKSLKGDIPIDWKRLTSVAERGEGMPEAVSWGWSEEPLREEVAYFARPPTTPVETRPRLF